MNGIARFSLLTVGMFLLGCASAPPKRAVLDPTFPSPTPAAPAAAPAGHDMAAMAGHDMAGMGRAHVETEFLFPDGDDKGWSKVENGMSTGHSMAPDVPLAKLPPAVKTELLRQLALTMDVIKKYPTVKDAEAAGYRRAGPFLPGLGTHYVAANARQVRGAMTDADILNPGTIIYDGTGPDSPIAGFMYMAVGMGATSKEPEGFAGPNDHWHTHVGICLKPGSNGATDALGFDGSITEATCKAKGGNYVAATQYLLHVWTVPGYTNPLGVFGHTSPVLTCADGTYYTDDHDLTNACRK